MGMLGYSISTFSSEEPRNIEQERLQMVEDTKAKIQDALNMITDALSDWDFDNNTNLLDRYVEGEDIEKLLNEIK